MLRLGSKKGQTIVEAVVALAAIMLTLAAIAVAILTSLNNSSFIQDQSLASKHSQEGMEYMRHLRNIDEATFETRDGFYCLNDDDSLTPGTCGGLVNVDNRFIREVEFSHGTSECSDGVMVNVSVYWSSGKCPSDDRFCHAAELVTCFATQTGTGDQL